MDIKLDKIRVKSLRYDEESNGHPCEVCIICSCGCKSGGQGGECIGCIYCNPKQEVFDKLPDQSKPEAGEL